MTVRGLSPSQVTTAEDPSTHDEEVLFMSLAFVLAVMKHQDATPKDMTARILLYAGQIEAFCAANSGYGLAAAGAQDSIDETGRSIERHLHELKQRGETRLPEDREGLIRLHDRLQHRKARRSLREVYAFSPEEHLANLVLSLLDEEISIGAESKLM